jgi:hypothetical protein
MCSYQATVKKGEDGEVNKVYLQCNRGKYRASHVQEQNRQRIKGTGRLDCFFSGILVRSKDIGAWVFQIRNSGHNHIPSSTQDELKTHFDSIQQQLFQ